MGAAVGQGSEAGGGEGDKADDSVRCRMAGICEGPGACQSGVPHEAHDGLRLQGRRTCLCACLANLLLMDMWVLKAIGGHMHVMW